MSQETIERLKEQAAQEAVEEKVPVDDDVSPDPEKPRGASSIREYIVFQKQDDRWLEITRANAGTADAAIKTLGENLKNNSTYAAIPARNWHEKSTEIETTTSVKLK